MEMILRGWGVLPCGSYGISQIVRLGDTSDDVSRAEKIQAYRSVRFKKKVVSMDAL
jgi:hypothetical protein